MSTVAVPEGAEGGGSEEAGLMHHFQSFSWTPMCCVEYIAQHPDAVYLDKALVGCRCYESGIDRPGENSTVS